MIDETPTKTQIELKQALAAFENTKADLSRSMDLTDDVLTRYQELTDKYGKLMDKCIGLRRTLRAAIESFNKAEAYINQTPCDPDIYPEQMKAWREYQEALETMKEVMK